MDVGWKLGRLRNSALKFPVIVMLCASGSWDSKYPTLALEGPTVLTGRRY